MTPETRELCERIQESFLQGDAYSKTLIAKHTLECAECKKALDQFNDVDARLSGAASAVPSSNDFVLRVLSAIEEGPPEPLSPSPPATIPNAVPYILCFCFVLISAGLLFMSFFGAFETNRNTDQVAKEENKRTQSNAPDAPKPDLELKPPEKKVASPKSLPPKNVERALSDYRAFEERCAFRSGEIERIAGRRLRRLMGVVQSLGLKSSQEWGAFIEELKKEEPKLTDKVRKLIRERAIYESERQLKEALDAEKK